MTPNIQTSLKNDQSVIEVCGTDKKIDLDLIEKINTSSTMSSTTPKRKIIRTRPQYDPNKMSEVKYQLDEHIKNNYFKNKIFKEIVDTSRLYALTKHLPHMLLKNEWWEEQGNMFKDIYGRSIGTEEKHLNAIFDRIYVNEKEHSQRITYDGSKMEYGRVYPKNANSLALLRRPIRHYLTKDIYYDFDFKNAHPTIHLNIWTDLKYVCEYLGKYVVNRTQILTEVMTSMNWDRDTAKTYFISILNGGSVMNYCKKNYTTIEMPNDFMIKYAEECERNIKAFCNEKKYKKLFNAITDGMPCNKNNRFMAFWGQMWEEQLLRIVFEYAVDNEYIDYNEPNCILAHDGIMFPKSVIPDPKIFCREVNKIIIEKTGLDYMKIVNKPMEEHTIITDEIQRLNIDDTEEWIDDYYEKYNVRRTDEIEPYDNVMRDIFLDKQINKYVLWDGNVFRLRGTGLYEEIDDNTLMRDYEEYMVWFSQVEKQKSFLLNPIRISYENVFYNMIKKANEIAGKCEEYEVETDLKQISKVSKEYKKLIADCEKLHIFKVDKIQHKVNNSGGSAGVYTSIKKRITDTKFGDKVNQNDYLLGFENGLMDLTKDNETGTFKKIIRNAEQGEYVSFSCGYDFPTEPNEEVLKMKEYARKTIREMFVNQEDMDYVMKGLSRSLRGVRVSNPEQIVMFARGEGSNGKSMLMEMVKTALGDYASNNFHSSYLQNTQKEERSTIIYGLRLRRFIPCEEPQKDKPFKADLFKNFTGGCISARTNYQTKNENIYIGNMFVCSNWFITFDSDTKQNSLMRRIIGINFPFQFFKEGSDNWDNYDKKNPLHKLADKDLEENIQKEEFKQAFMLLLMEYLVLYDKEGLIPTKQIKEDTALYKENLNQYGEWFKDNVVKPPEGTTMNISSQNFREYYNKRNGTSYNAKRFTQILTEQGYKKGTSQAWIFETDNRGDIIYCEMKDNVKCVMGVALAEMLTWLENNSVEE